jgi:hypothetical protein
MQSMRRLEAALLAAALVAGCQSQPQPGEAEQSATACAPPPVRTFSMKLTSKMFINTIPDANCLSSAFRVAGPANLVGGLAGQAAFFAFCKKSSLGENPPSDNAPVPLDARILSMGTATWKCQAGIAAPFGASFRGLGSVGGQEPGGLVGVANAPGVRDNINANGTFGFVSSGHPNPVAEPAFQAFMLRARPDIWDKTTVKITCGVDGRGQPNSTIAFTGTFTAFPSHKIFRRIPANAAAPKLVFNVPQKLFSDLWFLPAIPAP